MYIHGSDEWAHLTPRQARSLAEYLNRAADQAEARYFD
jgi:hypothetical protein